MHTHRSSPAACGFAFALAIALLSPLAVAQVPDADKKKIADAAPAEPIVKPKQDRKLLVFSRTTGFRHGSIPWGVEALRTTGEKTKAYTMDATEDPAVFTPDNLKQYDAIVFLNTTGDPVPDAAGRKAIEDFVSAGKGLVGIHSATDTAYNWKAYGQMMGGYFDGHPWNAGHVVTITVEDLNHSINKAAYSDKTFQHRDEIYQYKPEPYSRQKLRVLLSLDLTGPNMKPGGMKRADNDYAVGWVNTFGKGRIYYNNLGHNEATYWTPHVLKHFLAGIQFACGDLEADTTPSAVADKQAAASRLGDLMPKVASYKIGDDRAALNELEDIINANADAESAKRLVPPLVSLLDNADATLDAKTWALRQLSLVGSAAEVPAIAKLLTDDKLSHMARYALLRIEGDQAAAALRDALARTTGVTRIGVVETIGQRRDTKATDALAKLADDSDDATAVASLNALGHIGATGPLTQRLNQPEPKHAPSLYAAALAAAEANPGKAADAIYAQMLKPGKPDHFRIAALRGVVRSGDSAAGLDSVIKGDDATLRIAAIRMLQSEPGEKVTAQLVATLNAADPATQRVVVEALADRGDRSAGDAVAKLAGATQDADVRLAAVRALRTLGSAAHVPMLAKLAATSTGAERTEVRQTLAQLPHDGVDDAIVAAIESADPAAQDELVRTLGERRNLAAITKLLGSDKLSPAARTQAVKALADAAITQPAPQAAAALKSALALAKSADEKKAILAALSRVADQSALELAESMKSDAEVGPAATAAAERIAKLLEGPPVASASHNSDAATAALDANAGSRWDSGAQMRPGMWFMLDLKKAKTIRKITLDTRGSANDFPRGYELYIGDDPSAFAKPIVVAPADAPGLGPVTVIDAKSTKGRFIKIVQTGSNDSWYWSIHELTLDAD